MVSFYLFRVGQGQCGALQFPDGGWCFFDLGCSRSFSPVLWVAEATGTFICHRLTLSHLHYNHLADYLNLFRYPVTTARLVDLDHRYLLACLDSCSRTTAKIHLLSCWEMAKLRPQAGDWHQEGIQIRDRQIPLPLSRQVAGDPQSQVNNAGLVTRIEIYGRVLLILGDLQREIWEPLLVLDQKESAAWRNFLGGVDILIAPYHGQPEGFSALLLEVARPKLVLIPATAAFPVADSRYYQLPCPESGGFIPVLSTAQHGHLRLDFLPPILPELTGLMTWSAAFDHPPGPRL